MTGTVSPLYKPAMLLKRAGVIPGNDITSEAALAKLSYLLALPGLKTEDIIERMSISLRGEFTEQTNMVFEHPHDTLPSRLANLTSMGYAISKGEVLEFQKFLRGELGWLVNEADYSGNTPLVKPLFTMIEESFIALTVTSSTSQLQDPASRSYALC